MAIENKAKVMLALSMAIFACYCIFAIWNSGFDFGLLIPSTTPNLKADPAIYVVPEVEPLEPSEILNNGNGGEHVVHGMMATIHNVGLNQDIVEHSHATQRHSQEAESVRQCLKDYGSIHIFFNPATGRYANICLMEDGKYGLQIAEEEAGGKLHEITAFIKNQFKTWTQMAKYLENGGYTNMVK